MNLIALEARIYPIRKQLDQMRRNGSLSVALYNKGLMKLAFEYANAGFAQEALCLVIEIEPSYFREHAPAQMRQDPEYHTQAQAIYMAFMAAGITVLTFTQKPASA